ncbi:MAG TPA: DASS family sodium-coupled anion symporter [Nannocystaceae bacterium]|nr:DASS family sodium-coupled anion symporter [Nannocystaceae bacterium]
MDVAEAISAAEARFEARRRVVGLVLAPIVFTLLLVLPLPSLSRPAHALAAVAAAVVVLWITEAIPLAVAALLGPALAVLLDVAPADAAFAPIADPLIFLFLGGFLLAEGLARQGVDRRVALWLIARPVVKGSPARALIALSVISFGFSMWISNTATTAMLLPVALGLHATMREVVGTEPERRRALDRYGGGLCIMVAYSASIGGTATPIGTGPNVLAIGMLEGRLGEHFDFARWMVFALPTAITMLAIASAIAVRRFPAPVKRLAGLAAEVERQLAALGPVTPAERRAVGIFALAIAAWLAPSILQLALGPAHPATTWAHAHLDEGVVAIACASLLFVLPSGMPPANAGDRPPRLLAWEQTRNLDWGTLLLLGGGLALGRLTFETGLAEAIGRGVLDFAGPLAREPIGLMLAATALVLVLTEVTSNTAVTSMMLPVLIGIAQAAGIDPVPVALLATLAASFAFMLPVSTPPNAMAYGTRLVKIDQMLGFGIRLDLAGLALLAIVGVLLLPLVR